MIGLLYAFLYRRYPAQVTVIVGLPVGYIIVYALIGLYR